jgi:hypothetical protein
MPPPPSADGPEPRLVALHRERQLARDHLGDGYARGYLDAVELERRLERAERATTVDELRTLTEDLVHHPAAPAGTGAVTPAVPRYPAFTPAYAPVDLVAAPSELSLSAIFSESRHTGRWIPGRITHVRSLFAAMKLDLREAQLGPGITELRLAVTFAELQILVPPGVGVQVNCNAVFSDVSVDGEGGDADPQAPRVVLTGRVLFGAVKIRRRRPGESWWGAAKRGLLGDPAERRALPGRGRSEDDR